jgi:hypothetical protein
MGGLGQFEQILIDAGGHLHQRQNEAVLSRPTFPRKQESALRLVLKDARIQGSVPHMFQDVDILLIFHYNPFRIPAFNGDDDEK